jgi:NAD+-dependent farnesol dehydrogenase
MEKYLITGSTGFIGLELTKQLISEGAEVHLLVRDASKVDSLPASGVTVFEGDITDYASVDMAMKGCTHVFHLAAHARSFSKDPKIFDRINVEGTRNVLEAAYANKINKLVYTSTAGVFGTTGASEDATETSIKPDTFLTDYIRTKRLAEILCNEYSLKGLNIVTVYPTRVYGPGIMNESNSVTRLLRLVSEGKWRIIPGSGKSFGNYVFIGDVIGGLTGAMRYGKSSEDYILGGVNVTFDELFGTMNSVSGKNLRLYHIPYPLLLFASWLMVLIAWTTNKKPLISPGWLKNYLKHHRISSEKAIAELDYQITPLYDGLKKTFDWLYQNQTQHGK